MYSRKTTSKHSKNHKNSSTQKKRQEDISIREEEIIYVDNIPNNKRQRSEEGRILEMQENEKKLKRELAFEQQKNRCLVNELNLLYQQNNTQSESIQRLQIDRTNLMNANNSLKNNALELQKKMDKGIHIYDDYQKESIFDEKQITKMNPVHKESYGTDFTFFNSTKNDMEEGCVNSNFTELYWG